MDGYLDIVLGKILGIIGLYMAGLFFDFRLKKEKVKNTLQAKMYFCIVITFLLWHFGFLSLVSLILRLKDIIIAVGKYVEQGRKWVWPSFKK